MNFIKTKIEGLVVIEPKVFGDERGYFYESFNQQEFNDKIKEVTFIQDNESLSKRGVLRGLHFQKPPYAQSKLVRCIKGTVLDVVVDIRKTSSTYGEVFTIKLSEENKKQLFVPHGFAHGFSVLSEEAIFAYKVDNYYAPNSESGIFWDDKELNIDWQLDIDEIKLSPKDEVLYSFKQLNSPF